MTENTTTQTEATELEITPEAVVAELIGTAFEGIETVTAYRIATIINGAFKALEIEKQIPPQMMYNYARNGMINKVKGTKQFTQDEVEAFVTKYVGKFIK